MKRSMKYAALNIGILLLGVCFLAFAGAALEGGAGALGYLAVCACLAAAIRLAWKEVARMERVARMARRMAHAPQKARAAQTHRAAPDLRVA